jgi:hypothetical protein
MKNSNQKQLLNAQNKIEEIKNFYKHLVFFILINVLLTFFWLFSFKVFGDIIISNKFNDSGFLHYPLWLVLGIILAIHALKIFVFPKVFGNTWKDKKIKELMKE